MARQGRRKSIEEIVAILERQAEQGQTNAECAEAVGVSVETIKRWRARGGGRGWLSKPQEMVEWSPLPPSPTVELVVELPDGVRLTWPSGWDVGQVASLVQALRLS